LSSPLDALHHLDRVVHEPARLALLTALCGCASADFLFLQNLTGLTKGNLSVHLSKLEQAGLVRIDKGYRGKKPCTTVAATPAGTRALAEHWRWLDELRQSGAALAEIEGPGTLSGAETAG
jgi:DNA-binding MarR family transcriptional regulator